MDKKEDIFKEYVHNSTTISSARGASAQERDVVDSLDVYSRGAKPTQKEGQNAGPYDIGKPTRTTIIARVTNDKFADS